jgi:type 1 glutamine amidotransferase
MTRFLALALVTVLSIPAFAEDAPQWVTYEGKAGPGKGKHVVLVTGDDEYRSEESLPQLGKILAVRHGFKCTVLFAINKQTGAIDPSVQDNIPGLEALDTADLMVLFLRFRQLPVDQMKHIIDYTNSGKPIVALRTSTHAFFYKDHPESPYAKWSWDSKDPKGGYGREVLGETWINHYGKHEVQSTRGVAAPGREGDPILRGCEDVWGASDVYEVTALSGDSAPLLLGQVLMGMDPKDRMVEDKKQLPVAWTKTYTGTSGKPARVFTTTMGHALDFTNEGFRRMVVNAIYWGVGMEDQIPARNYTNVNLVGTYEPAKIGFASHRTRVMPADHALPAAK